MVQPYDVQQIYWNLRGDTVGFPVQTDTPNTQLISGFSVSLLKLFLTGDDIATYVEPEKVVPTPWDTFVKQLIVRIIILFVVYALYQMKNVFLIINLYFGLIILLNKIRNNN